MGKRKSIQVKYSKPESLLDEFVFRGPTGALFVATGRVFGLGEEVTVVVEFPRLRRSFRLLGRVVASRRGSARPALAAGIEVEFSSVQRRTLQMVLDSAEGKTVDFVNRRAARVPCSLEVTYRTDRDFAREFTEDLSAGGTFIRTQRKLPVGTELDCRLKPPGYLMGVKLRCRVAWLNDSSTPRGMGLEFIFASERQKRKVQQLVDKLTAAQTAQVERGVQAFKARKKNPE